MYYPCQVGVRCDVERSLRKFKNYHYMFKIITVLLKMGACEILYFGRHVFCNIYGEQRSRKAEGFRINNDNK